MVHINEWNISVGTAAVGTGCCGDDFYDLAVTFSSGPLNPRRGDNGFLIEPPYPSK